MSENGPHSTTSRLVTLRAGLVLAFTFASLGGCGQSNAGSVVAPTPVASDVRSSSPGPTPSGDETVSWQTYASTSYGYTLKFPAGWVAPTSPDNQQSFASENSGGPLGLSAH